MVRWRDLRLVSLVAVAALAAVVVMVLRPRPAETSIAAPGQDSPDSHPAQTATELVSLAEGPKAGPPASPRDAEPSDVSARPTDESSSLPANEEVEESPVVLHRRGWLPKEPIDVLVLAPDRSPVWGATVFFSGDMGMGVMEEGITDSAGRCRLKTRLRGRYLAEDAALMAVAPGYLPAELPSFLRWYCDHPGQVAVLRLPGESLTISGFVLNAAGEPAPDWYVSVLSGTRVGHKTLERLMHSPQPEFIEDELHRSGPEGEFELEGLLHSDYTLVAKGPSGYALAENVPGGSRGVVLRELSDGFREELHVCVLGRNGTPVEGVRVVASCEWDEMGSRSLAITDEQGCCTLQHVPRYHASLQVCGDHVASSGRFELDPDDWRDRVTVTVEREAPVRLELSEDVLLPLLVVAWDADGNECDLTPEGSPGSALLLEQRSLGGLWVSELAVRLTLRDPRREDRGPPDHEVELHLDPDLAHNLVRVGY